MTVDGFVASPNGELDWAVWNWDNEIKKYVDELTEPVDCHRTRECSAGSIVGINKQSL